MRRSTLGALRSYGLPEWLLNATANYLVYVDSDIEHINKLRRILAKALSDECSEHEERTENKGR